MLPKAIRAWNIMTHPDGEISLFNDSWFNEVPKVDLVATAHTLSQVESLPDAGYVRLQYGDYFTLFDCGEIGPEWNPGHGHADFLAIELDVAGIRFIVDPGTFQYSTGLRRHFERSAQSHNGPCWEDVEPVEYYSCFKVGKMVKGNICDVSVSNNFGRVVGELILPEGTVRRTLYTSDEGVVLNDTWEHGPNDAIVRLIIQKEWIIISKAEGYVNFKCGDIQVSLVLEYGVITNIESGEWACRYLQSEDATVIIMKPKKYGEDKQKLIWKVGKGRYKN
jgi:hypothetical protein